MFRGFVYPSGVIGNLSPAKPGGFCARRAGRLLGESTAFFAKESGGKESAEGVLPPLHSP